MTKEDSFVCMCVLECVLECVSVCVFNTEVIKCLMRLKHKDIIVVSQRNVCTCSCSWSGTMTFGYLCVVGTFSVVLITSKLCFRVQEMDYVKSSQR